MNFPLQKNIEEENFQAISNLIDKYVNSETQYQKGCLNQRTQMCFALKPGLNGMLDVSRKTYTEIVEDIQGFFNNSLLNSITEIYGFRFSSESRIV